jgi:hypothetical protein
MSIIYHCIYSNLLSQNPKKKHGKSYKIWVYHGPGDCSIFFGAKSRWCSFSSLLKDAGTPRLEKPKNFRCYIGISEIFWVSSSNSRCASGHLQVLRVNRCFWRWENWSHAEEPGKHQEVNHASRHCLHLVRAFSWLILEYLNKVNDPGDWQCELGR